MSVLDRPNGLQRVLICESGILRKRMWKAWIQIHLKGRRWAAAGSTCDIVAEAHGGQGDDYKIGGLQQGPLLHLLEDQDGHCNEEQAAQQDGQQGGDHSHDGRAHPPFLPGTRGTDKGKYGGSSFRESLKASVLRVL